MPLRELMKQAGLGSTFRKMTVSALNKAIDNAKSKGEEKVSRGSWDASLSVLEPMLAEVEKAAGQVDITKTQLKIAKPPKTLTMERKAESAAENDATEISTTHNATSSKQIAASKQGEDAGPSEDEESLTRLSGGLDEETTTSDDKEATLAKNGIDISAGTKRKRDSDEDTDSAFVLDNVPAIMQPAASKRTKTLTESQKEQQAQKREMLGRDLLTWHEIEALQVQDYGADEREAFEAVRQKFRTHAKAREGLRAIGSLKVEDTQEVPSSEDDPDSASGVNTEIADQPAATEDSETEAYIFKQLLSKYKLLSEIYQPEPLSEKLVTALKDSLKTPPRFLYRASSWEGRKHTSGHDTMSVHIPAAHKNKDEKCHDTIYEIPNGLSELLEMLGHRFLWADRRRDETLSWTSSLLFALVHATGRLAKGQRHVVIHVIDTTKVTTIEGGPVEFHFAPDLMRILDIQGWYKWNEFEHVSLRQPWYTHEWISHHVVKSPARHSYEVDIEELVKAGLYEFVKSFQTPEKEQMRSLYHRCCFVRSKEHREGAGPKPMSMTELEYAKRLASCFLEPSVRDVEPAPEPPVTIFLDLLGLVARPRGDDTFREWMRQHYSAGDLATAGYASVTRVANNLPESTQVLDLVRDACVALGVPAIPRTRVWMADADFNWGCKWLKALPKDIKNRESRAGKRARQEKNKGKSAVGSLADQLLRDEEGEAGKEQNGENPVQDGAAEEDSAEPGADAESDATAKTSGAGTLPQRSPSPVGEQHAAANAEDLDSNGSEAFATVEEGNDNKGDREGTGRGDEIGDGDEDGDEDEDEDGAEEDGILSMGWRRR
ncbi:hypothetical protein LTR08_005190 [Meristemomyces frigidus]|nr:hypothetical protein LTR08_005190 [Meristemomyces frigidus]